MKDVILSAGIKHVVYMDSYPPDAVSEQMASVAGITLVKAGVDFAFTDATHAPWSSGSRRVTVS
jgi:deoxycytidylate deaminase